MRKFLVINFGLIIFIMLVSFNYGFSQELLKLLNDDFKIKDKVGNVKFVIGGIEAIYNGKDALGDLIQSWIEAYLKESNIYYRLPSNSQAFPDFYLDESDTTNLLEIKTFNYSAGPAFDVANFTSYSKSLLENPHRLNADYLVLGYTVKDREIRIAKMWVLKVWELCGSSGTNPLNIQTKDKQPYNIRPIRWYSETSKNKPFKNKLEFIDAISETQNKYEEYSKSYKEQWKETVINKYEELIGKLD